MTINFNTGFTMSEEAWDRYTRRKIGQTWKLLPMREKNENWEKQAKTIIVELSGINDLTINEEDILAQILGKLQGLFHIDDFMFYRKTVFEVIALLEELTQGGGKQTSP